ncbi:MAG: winged helix-turn-helix domain-containing protein [Myxococcota bacterium]
MQVWKLKAGRLDLHKGLLERASTAIPLSPIEQSLLQYLAAREGEAIPQDELLREVWGYHDRVQSRTVRVTIGRIRNKIELNPKEPEHLITIRGEGYLFQAAPIVTAPPNSATGLFGRDAALAALSDALSRDVPLIAIVGPGGMGKTRLAQALAAQWPDSWWCDAEDAHHPQELIGALAMTLDLSLDHQPSIQIQRALAARSGSLGIIDNLEQIEDVEETLIQWVAAGAGPLLVTSRRRLVVPGGETLELPPLDADAAAQMLLARWRQRQMDVTAEALAPLGSLLSGLPLAIELAAGWADTLPPHLLVRLLEDTSEPLEAAEPQTLPPRHRSLTAALAGSWSMLDRQQQGDLAALAVFRGGAPLTVALSMLGPGGLRRIRALRQLSLVQQDPESGRLSLMVSVRELATRRLPAVIADARRRHRDAYLALINQHARLSADAVGLRLRDEHNNLRAALEQCAANTDEAGQLALTLHNVLMYRVAAQQQLAILQRAGRPPSPDLQVRLQWSRAQALQMMGRIPEAVDALRDAIDRSQNPADRFSMNLELTRLLFHDNQIAAARRRLADMESRVGIEASTLNQGHFWRMKGLLAFNHDNDLDDAEQSFQRALQIFSVVDRVQGSSTRANLAQLRAMRGDPRAAVMLLTAALRDLDDSPKFEEKRMGLRLSRASCLELLGDLDAAIADLDAALAYDLRIGDQFGITYDRSFLLRYRVARGDDLRDEDFGVPLAAAITLDNPDLESAILRARCLHLAETVRPDQAAPLMSRLRPLTERAAFTNTRSTNHLVMGQLLLQRGHRREAAAALAAAAAGWAQRPLQLAEARCLLALAKHDLPLLDAIVLPPDAPVHHAIHSLVRWRITGGAQPDVPDDIVNGSYTVRMLLRGAPDDAPQRSG